jgi:hypothetical protein
VGQLAGFAVTVPCILRKRIRKGVPVAMELLMSSEWMCDASVPLGIRFHGRECRNPAALRRLAALNAAVRPAEMRAEATCNASRV